MRKMKVECDTCASTIASVKLAIVVSETKLLDGGKIARVTKDYCSDKCLKEDRGYTVEEVK
jgi:hypothetical protein